MARQGMAYVGRLMALATLYVLAAQASFALANVHTSIASVWLPSGLAVAAVLLFGYRVAPGVWLGAFAFNALTPVPLWVAGLIAVGNTLEAVTAAALLRRTGFRPEVDRVRDVLVFAGLGALVAPLASATVGIGSLLAGGVLRWEHLPNAWVLWWSGDAVGVLALTPALLLGWLSRRERRRLSCRRLVEAGALALAVPLVEWVGLTAGVVKPFVVFPVLVWAAIRFRRAGANLASLFISAVAVFATARGVGPFAHDSLEESLLLTQDYVAVVMATALLLAAMTVERERITDALRHATAEIELRNRELEDERERLDEAQRIAHVGSWDWDVASDVVRWSDELYRIYGLGPQWVILDYQGFLDRVHPDDRERVEATVAAAYAVPAGFSFEHRIVRPDGEVRTIQARGMAIRDDAGVVVGMFGTGQDVTERKRVEQALRVQQEQTGAILDTASDAFIGFDERGIVTDWNRSAETLLGWSAEEAIGRDVIDLVLPEPERDAGRVALYDRAANPAAYPPTTRTERTFCHRDGRELPVESTTWLVSSAAGWQFNTFARDIAERKRFERALATARDEALEASRTKSQFLATMSHEIRTPMNGVIGLAALLLRSPLDGAQRRHVEGIQNAGETLLAIINDILDFSKIEAGRLILDDVDFDLDVMMSKTVALLTEAARAKGLSVVVVRQPDLPAALRGDPVRLAQILLNLVSNAVKFTEDGRVTIHARLAGPASLADGGVLLRMEVADTGIGIPQEKQAQLFDPFVQADTSTTREYGGTGLGLAICRRLAEAMGGRLEVSSSPGRGSTFSCTIPLAVAKATAGPEVASAPAGPEVASVGPEVAPAGPEAASAPADGVRLLLVEDNRLNEMVAVEILTRLGYRIDVASNGRRAVEMAQATRYHAILMDCQMPVMDGYTATAELRRIEGAARRTPIIAMTAGAFDEDRQRCLAAGMDDFLAKPFDLDALAATVARWTSNSGAGVTVRPR